MGMGFETYVVKLEGKDGPVAESDEFLNNGLYPHLDEGELLAHTIDGNGSNISLTEIRLVKHVGIMVQSEQVAHGISLLGCEESVDIP
jgi:hypothetical protein